jgi:type IV secretion system protein VirB1
VSALAITSALIALSVQCAPTVAPGTLLSFARAESGLDPLAIHSNANGRSYYPATKAEAIAIASRMIARGERPDLGFMQINVANLAFLRLSITRAFELCPSIAAGARILHGGYDPCVDVGGDAQACLRIAASTYNTGSPTRGFANGYVHLIAAAAAHVIPAIAVAGQPAPEAQQTKADPAEPTEPFDLGSGDDDALTTTYEKDNP